MFDKAILHFQKVDPILFEIAQKNDPFELEIHPKPFVRLTRSIIGQQLSVKAAQTIYLRFEKLFDSNEIKPSSLLNIPEEKLRSAGISFQKISYLKDLASKISKKQIILEKLNRLESDLIIEELIKIKGIGKWTSEMFLMFTLGRPDIFSFGDLGLQNAIKKVYGMKEKPTVKQMSKISKKWSPYRTYAARILWDSLDNQPK